MSCGLLVICSNVCDNPYIVENGDNGYLFNPYDSTDMADAIERLLAMSNEEYSAMSIKNRERSISLFSKNTFVGKYIELLK